MNQGSVVFTVLVLVIASMIGFVHVLSQSSRPSQQGVLQEGIFAPCYSGQASVNTTVNWTSSTINILQVDPGDTGYLCIDYSFETHFPPSYKPHIAILITTKAPGSFKAESCDGANGTAMLCPGIRVPYQTATLFPAPSAMVVGAKVTVDSTAKQGLYWLQYGQACSITVLYVGQPPSQLSLFDVGGSLFCIAMDPAPTVRIIGTKGFQVMALPVGSP